ncbi:MAG: serine hydrolase [Phenylobacterium sp.]|uniref:serine hydrolase domain-containing protein n=1 Tax=Phenylobacterium sp. TaxID=1871053 RepID=UPI0026014004|nr:serine hydrolase [Phenylobacterium sp.]MCA3709413.1 serine hydrolase [Phenylobacterium sp.]
MTSAILPPLPVQPPGVDWPTLSWSRGPLPPSVDAERLARLIDHGFTDFEETHAVVVVQGGRLVLDRYGPAHGPEATCLSWSMAKSITHALVGIAVGDGLLDIMAPAPVPEWRSPGDPRGAITTDQLLRMSSGLRFSEVYEPDKTSDTIEMMWGSGKADVAHYATSQPLDHPPGTFFSYSSGTTNIICRILADVTGLRGEAFAAFMRERLFEPLGMRTPVPKFDPAGTFIGSSFCFASGQDFARFGLLYLRDGVWNGRRLLPEGWVDYARTRTFQQAGVTDDPYGAHWWLGLGGEGSFSANGHEGQFTLLAPDLDLIIVRHGRTGAALKDALKVWMGEMAAAFRT